MTVRVPQTLDVLKNGKYLVNYDVSLEPTKHKTDRGEPASGLWQKSQNNAPASLNTCVHVNGSKNTKINITTDGAMYNSNVWRRLYRSKIKVIL